jgi:uncharacterized membrane protein
MRGPPAGSPTDLAKIQHDDHYRNLDIHRGECIPLRKTIAKAVTWRLIGTAEIFAISFWTTGHIATAGHTAGIAAITSFIMYVAHELAWRKAEGCSGITGPPPTPSSIIELPYALADIASQQPKREGIVEACA